MEGKDRGTGEGREYLDYLDLSPDQMNSDLLDNNDKLMNILQDPFVGGSSSNAFDFAVDLSTEDLRMPTSIPVSVQDFHATGASSYANSELLSVNLAMGFDAYANTSGTDNVNTLSPNFYEGDQFKVIRNVSSSNLSDLSSTSPYLSPHAGSVYDDHETLSPALIPHRDDEDNVLVSNTLNTLNTLNLENEFALTESPPVITVNDEDSSNEVSRSLFNRSASPLVETPSNTYLSPEDTSQHTQMRLGRQRLKAESSSRSTSRSRSRSSDRSEYSSEDFEDDSELEETDHNKRMAELASPNWANKRAQKNPSVFPCDMCEKRFTRPYNLKSHRRTHTNEKPYICKVCGKPFARQHDRKRHEDLHTGEKKYQCRGELGDGTIWGCGRKFARTDALRRHFQTESGKKCISPVIREVERDKQKEKLAKTDSEANSEAKTEPGLLGSVKLEDSASFLDQLINTQELNFK